MPTETCTENHFFILSHDDVEIRPDDSLAIAHYVVKDSSGTARNETGDEGISPGVGRIYGKLVEGEPSGEIS